MNVDEQYECEKCGLTGDVLVTSNKVYYWKTCDMQGEDLPVEDHEYDGTGVWEEIVSCAKCGAELNRQGGQ